MGRVEVEIRLVDGPLAGRTHFHQGALIPGTSIVFTLAPGGQVVYRHSDTQDGDYAPRRYEYAGPFEPATP